MSQQDFDRHLKTSLDRYPSELDTEALWNDLAPHLTPRKKRRRFIFWWWTGAGLLLTLACWGGYLVIGYRNDQVPSMPVKANQGSIQAADTRDEINPLSFDQPDKPEKGAVQPGTAVKKPETGESSALPPKDTEYAETNILSAIEPDPKQGREGALPEQNDAPLNNDFAIMNEPATDEQTIRRAWEDMDLLPALRGQFLPDTLVLSLPVVLLPSTPDQVAGWRRIFRVESGIGKTFKTLRQDSASVYLTTRRTTERPLEYISASLMGGMQHRSGWYFMTGVGYTRINERFEFQRRYTETETLPDGVTGITIGPGGDTTFTYGPLETIHSFFYRKRTYNSYTLIDLPLVAGFSLERDRLSLALEGGVVFNLRLKAQGEIFDRLDGYIRLEDSEYFRANAGLSYFGSLRLGYAVNCNLQVSVSPFFRGFSGSFTTDEIGMTQKYTLVGVNLGARWRF